MSYTTYNFNNFDYFDSLIYIPINSVFYRGIRDLKLIKNFDILRKNVPIYLASKISARKYSDGNDDQIFSISTTDSLKVLDIRKIQHILQLIMDSYKFKKKYGISYFSIRLN